jgi:hypothetical protein
MSSIVATVDSKRAQVRLDIDLSDVMAPAVTVTRTNLATGVSTVVRSYGSTSSGAPTTLLGRLVLYDTEAAFDVPLQYTAAYNSGSALVVQNLNPYFENGTKGQWAGQNNAIFTVTNSQAHQGLWSGLITPDGITAVPQAQSDEIAVTPLKSYTFGAWLRTTSNATRNAGIFWFDAGHAFISANTVNTALVAGIWTQYGPIAYNAPANALFARIKTNDPGTPGAGNPWWIDEATISTTVNVSVTSSVVIVPSNGNGWLKDPARPGNNVLIDCRRPNLSRSSGVGFLGLGDRATAANGTTFNVNNSAYPVPVSRLREAPTSSLRLLGRSALDVGALGTLLAPGSPLLLQLPSAYGRDDAYVFPGNAGESYVFNDQRRAARLISFPFATVLSPAGPMQGVQGVRWQDLCVHAATWGAVYATLGGVYDGFGRTVAAGAWGTPDVPSTPGVGWTVGGANANDFSLPGSGVGQIAVSVVNASDRATIGSAADTEQYLTVIPPVTALGAPYQVAVLARHAANTDYYRLGLEFTTGGNVNVFITKRVAAVETSLASISAGAYTPGQIWRIHAKVIGTALQVSGWKDGFAEPVEFTASVTDSALVGAAAFGVYARLNVGNTNVLPVSIQVEDYQAKGALSWQGIMDGALA